MEDIIDALEKCPIFEGIPRDKYRAVLSCLSGKVCHYEDGALIDSCDLGHKRAGVVLSGCIQLSMYLADSKVISIKQVSAGNAFGFDLSGLSTTAPVEMRAKGDMDVLYLDFNPVFAVNSDCRYKAAVTANLLRSMSDELVFLNNRIRLLAEPRLREKIMLYLNSLGRKGDRVTLDMNRNELASYLSIDRSALSRELGRMQQEGLIKLDGRNHIILLSVAAATDK